MLRMVRRFCVMFSPRMPSPRVAPRTKLAVLVDQRDGQAVDLRLADQGDVVALGRRARRGVYQARSSSSLKALPRLSIGRRCSTTPKRLDRLAADALGRRVRRDQLRELRFERAQLAHQHVVLAVGDLGTVEDVVAVVVVVDLGPQLFDAQLGFLRLAFVL